MLACSTVRTKDSWLITRFQTLWPRWVTMLWHLCHSTLSKPHQIQWVWIHFCCSSNLLLLGTDVLKYELCVYPPALFGLLAPCCNPTCHPKQMAYRDEYNLQEPKSPRMSVTSIRNRKYKDYVYRKMLVQEYLKKKRIFKKVKPQNDLMYQDIYNCICQNTKKK